MTELKPCPFCGRAVRYIYDAAGDPYGVNCLHCHMITRFIRVKPPGPHEKFERTMNDIAERWNRRRPSVQPEQKTGKWIPQDYNLRNGRTSTLVYYCPKCSVCGKSGDYIMRYCPNCGAKMEEQE